MKYLKRTLIVGAGAAGQELARELKKNLSRVFRIVGFVDDDKKKLNKLIKGIKVLAELSNLEYVIRKNHIDEVFIALPSEEGETIKRIIDSCNKGKVVFKIVPRTLEIILGKVKLPSIREVRIEDLLGRPIIRSDQKKFIDFFKGKRILVTGAAGSIGSELCRQLIQFVPKKIICLDIWESGLFELDSQLKNLGQNNYEIVIGNIQDQKKIDIVFGKYKPEIIFHAAAFKHVPIMQIHPDEAIKNNVFGTKVITDKALKFKVMKFINISTDKAADPSSVMGATKLLAEKITFSANRKYTKFISVRFGNVLDSQGSVVPIFRKQILNGGPITVTDPEMTRYFMTIPEAVQLVLEASVLGEEGELFVLDMGEPVKIVEMARLMIRLFGFLPDKEIKIKYIGRRPGEKISEILYTDKEILEKTESKKIFKIRQNTQHNDKLSKILVDLKKIVYSKKKQSFSMNKQSFSMDRKKIIEYLKEIAPNLQN